MDQMRKYMQVDKIRECLERFGPKQKTLVIGIASLAVGYILYRTWRSWRRDDEHRLFYSLKANKNPRTIKVLVIGLDCAGKKTFTRKFCKRRHQSDNITESTIGAHIKQNFVTVGDLSISFWNVGGSIYGREMWHSLFNLDQMDFIIYCVDSSQPTRFVEARKELHKFLKNRYIRKTPLILLATKQDRHNSVDPYTLYLTMNLENFQETRPIHTTGIQISPFGRTKGFLDLYNLLATVDKQKNHTIKIRHFVFFYSKWRHYLDNYFLCLHLIDKNHTREC